MRTVLAFLLGIIFGSSFLLFALKAMRSEQPLHPTAANITASPSNDSQAGLALEVLTAQLPWAAIESTNYLDYVRNLRSIRCPEGTVAIIIQAELMKLDQLTTPRSAADFRDAVSKSKAARQVLDDLGLPPIPDPGDFLLTPEKRAKFHEAVRKFPSRPGQATEAVDSANRRQFLGSLTAEEDIYFKCEFENYGQTVSLVLAGFTPTQDEFYRMISNMHENTPAALTNLLADLLSEDRYAKFVSCQSPKKLLVFQFGQRFPNTKAKAPQLENLLEQRSSLDNQEFRNRLRSLLTRDQFDVFLQTISTQ